MFRSDTWLARQIEVIGQTQFALPADETKKICISDHYGLFGRFKLNNGQSVGE